MKFTVAIDGPAAAGKGTIAKAVAAHFGFAHLDTGLLYRAVGVLAKGGDPVKVARALSPDDLQRDDLRSSAAAELASKVAPNPDVRAALLTFQREFASRDGGAVLDGRDIGTVICPDADVKLFVTASPEIRAKRRLAEFGPDASFAEVLADVQTRDKRDAERIEAPMKPAQDALLLDTSKLTADRAVYEAIRLTKGAVNKDKAFLNEQGYEYVHAYLVAKDLYSLEIEKNTEVLLIIFLPDWDGNGKPMSHWFEGDENSVPASVLKHAIADIYKWREDTSDAAQKGLWQD